MNAPPQQASQDNPSGERRSHARHECALTVRCSFDRPGFDDTGEIRNGQVENISRGGFFVSCRRVEPPDTPVQLSLQPPGRNHWVYLGGRVARTAASPGRRGMGIVLDAPLAQVLFEALGAPP